ncbi:polysaccharide deacetylase family protein [Komarekiella sp. 'clone 1']|uniref:Polysaccharide deacetylase family protein n=1 Tax=Komarekiella delphini-convector SJRDD-AB1 TaxID=2593771 RepID=A0AA40T564_9NOST|nr:polysaccharide deacetylase family protein [Komarekiella delphini-convector]MBD6620863.1 polysaccharide deacetylase family protein [Komarekiella delphini-convector SJRDD-AB1]
MTNNNENNFLNTQKPKTFSASLALVFILFFTILNTGNTEPIIPILGFHGIIDPKASTLRSYKGEMNYQREDLEKLLEYLVLNDYWFLSTQDLYSFFLKKSHKISAEHRNKKTIMISFDDGYKTVHTNLLPILYKLENKYRRRVKVVLFINPGSLASNNSVNSVHLGCQELREGFKKGFYDIQSHGMNHKNLTNLPRHQLVNELLQARTELRKCTQDLDIKQTVASHFAYPYGAYTKQVKYYVSKYYLSSYLYNDKILNYACLKDYHVIPRLMVNRQKSTQQLIEMAKGLHPINDKEKC